MNAWACEGAPLSTFFGGDDIPWTKTVDGARDYCDTCPARAACLKMALEAEGDDTAEYRAGIFGGMTPFQRHSLRKRGVALECANCGESYDPVELREGKIACRCEVRSMPPIPHRGDQWVRRHTKLARMTLHWLIDNVEVGGEVPDALALSRQLKVAVKDMRRVYQALKEDLILRRDNGKLVRRYVAEAESWTPPHLRSGTGI